jgi:hypothetical protein
VARPGRRFIPLANWGYGRRRSAVRSSFTSNPGALIATHYGDRLVILTGHDHEQHIDRYGEILVIDAGAVGAGGLLGGGAEPVGVAQLHIADGRTWPRAVDLMQVEPLSGAATAERFIPASDDVCDRERANCHDEG